ncbi:melibiose/raffinose/stachyose import permease protein MelD [Demequina sediminis]|uniref:Melibiose/raffinose/stachyose import permease protein MelD n=1 Tax=Demequina sediminis TaxID=1930058 RepID=A0ABP9WEI4_9MICO|nr:sugar ABC transporter permease [Demequina sediminis]BDZ62681.1 sugar ABC transporter permease [Demequina sediminis]
MTALEASGRSTVPAVDAQASAAGPRPVTPATDHPRRDTVRKWAEIALFVGPALVLFLTFVVYPVVSAARFSLYKWNGVSQFSDAEFIGFENYARALFGGTDPATQEAFVTAYSEPFWQALSHNFAIIFLSMAVQLPIALLVALTLNRKFRGRAFTRVVIFAPYVLSEVIAGIMWLIIFDPNGIATEFMQSIGLDSPAGGWLEDPTWGFWTVFFIITWKYVGLAIILFLAGLSGVSEDLQEAAAIDGASWWQIQWRINIPLIGPTIRIWAFLSIIGSIQLFDMVWVLNRGGTAGQYSTIASYMMEIGFFRADWGYGSAIAVIMFILSFVIALAYMATILRRDNAHPRKAR